MFLAKGLYRDCELDSFKDGCKPNSGYSIQWDVNFEARTMEDLLKEIKDFHSTDEVLIEDGKMYIQVYEIPLYDRWITPTEQDIQNWKNGKQELFLVDYSYRLFEEMY